VNTTYSLLAIAGNYFQDYIDAETGLKLKLSTLQAQDLNPDEPEQSRLLQMYDDVAVVSIKGSLTNSDSYWNRFFGAISYSEIREALIQATEAEAQVIVLDIDSPGGSVKGMSDTANLISTLPMKTISFTSGMMCSAGYFLGCQADDIYADSMSEVGSIGVVAELFDRTKMLKDIGIKPIRFRSGPLKAVGSPNHTLSKEETKYLQDKIMTYAESFFTLVSDARGIPRQVLDTYGITSGRTFIGVEAQQVGLVDGVKTFDEIMLNAFSLAEKRVDKPQSNGLFSNY